MWHADGISSAGAGCSSVYPRPAYQDDVAAVTGGSMRSVPDLSMDATDGTSEAAPLLAGVLALATQANGGDVGPVNPALYGVLGPAGTRDGVEDVVRGDDSVIKNGKVVVPGFAAGPGFDVASGWGTLYAPSFVPALVAATRAADQDVAARGSARGQLAALENDGIRLARAGDSRFYLLGGGFLPMHPVRLAVDGRQVAVLHANRLGDVTWLSGPLTGPHSVALASMLITETMTIP
jgi:hypothetical protein